MSIRRFSNHATGECFEQKGEYSYDNQGNYGWAPTNPIHYPCGTWLTAGPNTLKTDFGQISSIAPFGSTGTATASKLPMRFAADNGTRPVDISVTETPGLTLALVDEKDATGAAGGCGCTGNDAATGSCCTKKKLISVAVGLLFVGALIGLAYGITKIFK
ncbi:MAG: hypothetical protein K9G46_07130 [Flavobacteriales bacterium]|nr:hypothetical protein [Flavobacteriales bacterium]